MRVFTPTSLYEHLLSTCSDEELDVMEKWLTDVLSVFQDGDA